MCVAVQLDRRNIPAGIWRQKDMGSPNTRTSKPSIARKCAAADRAYGPAPTIATSHAVMVVSLENLPPEAHKPGVRPVIRGRKFRAPPQVASTSKLYPP